MAGAPGTRRELRLKETASRRGAQNAMPSAFPARPLALLSVLAFAFVAASEPGAAPAPPDGTYVYSLSRNGTQQGVTTVTVFRRAGQDTIETDEAGSIGAARAHVIAAYSARDLATQSYAATYQAPFLRTSPFGRVARFRPGAAFTDQTTVRYHVDDKRAFDTIDGVAGERVFSLPGVRGPLHDAWIFDAPFMTGVLLLPGFRQRTHDATFVTLGDAFGDGAQAATARIERGAPRFPKTPKGDLVLDVAGVAQLWFDPATLVLHEAHFDALNLDARLVSYAKAAVPAPFVAAPAASATPAPAGVAVSFAGADGTKLAGEIAVPAGVSRAAPAIVFVPPGPNASRNFGGDGPDPMFPGLAASFVKRGYAVLRYDTRGVGKSGGSSAAQTWDQARADAVAAVGAARAAAGIDPNRVFLLGYGNGADLALAAALQPGVRPAGVVALAPTVTSYAACAPAGGGAAAPGESWRKSASGHDPAALAARANVPVFVLQPGIPICGETSAQREAYDEKLRANDPAATIVVASDLTERFGGRYDADSPANTEALFPYRFDASTAGAVGDWLDGPKTAGTAKQPPAAAQPRPRALPPPPPPAPLPEASGAPATPEAPAPPAGPTQPAEPGVVLPSGMTPPPQ